MSNMSERYAKDMRHAINFTLDLTVVLRLLLFLPNFLMGQNRLTAMTWQKGGELDRTWTGLDREMRPMSHAN